MACQTPQKDRMFVALTVNLVFGEVVVSPEGAHLVHKVLHERDPFLQRLVPWRKLAIEEMKTKSE